MRNARAAQPRATEYRADPVAWFMWELWAGTVLIIFWRTTASLNRKNRGGKLDACRPYLGLPYEEAKWDHFFGAVLSPNDEFIALVTLRKQPLVNAE